MPDHDELPPSPSGCLPTALLLVTAAGLVGVLVWVTGGWVLVLAAIIGLHYVLWGWGMNRRAAVERAREELEKTDGKGAWPDARSDEITRT